VSELGEVLAGAGMIGIGAGMAAGEQDAFAGSTLVVAGVMAVLGAQEAEQAVAWRMADIAAMRALLGDAAPVTDDALSLSAVEAAWATLSDALIAHHAAVEAAGNAVADAAILAFYRESSERRELVWPM
jgi:hypothetical protein